MEWQLWHKHSTRRNDDACIPLAFQMYLTIVPQCSRKNLLVFTWIHHNKCSDTTWNCKLKILQFKDLSWNLILYFRLTLVSKELKWIPNHFLCNEHKKGLKHLHGIYKLSSYLHEKPLYHSCKQVEEKLRCSMWEPIKPIKRLWAICHIIDD
jgi:hypothetical protein